MNFWEGRLTNNRPTGGVNFFLASCEVSDERRDFLTGNDGHLAKGPSNRQNFRILTPSESLGELRGPLVSLSKKGVSRRFGKEKRKNIFWGRPIPTNLQWW